VYSSETLPLPHYPTTVTVTFVGVTIIVTCKYTTTTTTSSDDDDVPPPPAAAAGVLSVGPRR
jgi:hypothetical protein